MCSSDLILKPSYEKDQVIYPGKLSTWDGFRIGTIGRITATDVKVLLNSIRETLDEMHVQLKPVVVKER